MVGGATGLHLKIEGDARSWILRVTIQGKRHDIGLGAYPAVTLATARKLALDHHDTIAGGGHPLEVRREARVAAKKAKLSGRTFAECAKVYLAAQEGQWKNAKHASQWEATLKAYAYPAFGDKLVAEVDTIAVLRALEPIWRTKTETATRLRGRIERVLGWATFQGFRSGENPARWRDHLDHHLPARGDIRKVVHHASLPYQELPTFMADLRRQRGTGARALEFAVLTAARSGEVRHAKFAEFDLDRRTWTIPAERMKAAREHIVPLSDPAVKIIKAQSAATRMPAQPIEDRLVFPAPRGGALSDAVWRALFDRMGFDSLTQHGFRSSFREWAGEQSGHQREVIEHALAHQLADKAEAAYQRGSLLPKRIALMSDWAAFCGNNGEFQAKVDASSEKT